ncbi:nitroreductase family protein (plasmid) [Paraclostridium ghonii]|uniref:nitroreductase family protein n=1 Tax=Paraclostridium ghonii TaxID=29358 RepID=UPI00202CD181|nr:nitroreductase family protein [Paeniclostridium ghonii]MCM0165114.1 nitroreductase family protein [Paeniclostridium ghonii]
MLKEIQNRRSIRKYTDKEVEQEKIIELLDAARIAASGSNTQPWNFIIVKSEKVKEELAKVSHNQSWMLTAPVFIVCVADISSRIKENDKNMYLDENSPQEEVKQIIRDTSIAITNIMIQAVNLDLSTCWVAWFRQKEIRPILNIPNDKYVVGILTLGYADESPNPRPRKSIEDIIHFEKW